MASAQMAAVYLVPTRQGGEYEYRQVKTPAARGGQVLVEVAAAGINRGEILAAQGYHSRNPRLRPAPAGIEFAGTIAAVGEDATGWHVGERVMGRSPGSYADFTLCSCMTLMRIPERLTFTEAAAIPNVFITAHDALITNAQMRQGDAVMITAAASGVGTAAIQLARHQGAGEIIATTRDADKFDGLRAVGASSVVDTTAPDYLSVVNEHTDGKGVNVVIDNVGGPLFSDNLNLLALQGRIISVGRNGGDVGTIDLDALARKRAKIIGTTFRTRSSQEAWRCFEVFVEDCMDGFIDGSLAPILDRSFPFDALHEAHSYMMTDSQVGKIVLART